MRKAFGFRVFSLHDPPCWPSYLCLFAVLFALRNPSQ